MAGKSRKPKAESRMPESPAQRRRQESIRFGHSLLIHLRLFRISDFELSRIYTMN
jgi:hypothetical protein